MKNVTHNVDIQVKICGLTNLDDAKAALDLGADFLGFVLYEKSPRFVSPSRLQYITDHLASGVRAVGVFVNRSRIEVLKIARDCGLFAVQIHGLESSNEFMNMPLPLWRSVFFGNSGVNPQPSEWKADRYIIDVKAPGKYDGLGLTADWKRAAGFSRKWPSMLAGGLNEWNVIDAVRKVRPLGVDVSSGIEKKPGRKDRKKLELFIHRAKSLSCKKGER